MPITIEMPKTLVQHRGYFDYAQLMRATKGWFDANEYMFEESKHKYSGADGKVEVEMIGKKKINEYVRFLVIAWVRVWDMKDAELIRGGDRVQTQEGRVAVEVSGTMELDWQNRFGGSKLMQALQDFLHRFILKTTIEDVWKDKLYLKMRDLTRTVEKAIGSEGV